MVIFGDIINDEFKFNHDKVTGVDVAMNYGCGAVLAGLATVGIPLNCLIYWHYLEVKVAWTARYLRYLSALTIGILVLGAIPQAIILLMPGYVGEGGKHISMVAALGCYCLWHCHQIMVFMLCLMQYMYLLKPYWCMVYGTRFKRLVLVAIMWVVLFFLAAFVITYSLPVCSTQYFGWVNQIQIFYAHSGKGGNLMLGCLYIPGFLLLFLSIILYIVTRVQLRHSYSDDVEITPRIRANFRVIALLLLSLSTWGAMEIGVIASVWGRALSEMEYESFYYLYMRDNVVSPLLAGVNSLVVTLVYPEIRGVVAGLLTTGRISHIQQGYQPI